MDRHRIGFAFIGSLMSIIFLMIVNYLTSPNYLWFFYPAFVLLLWPISLFFIKKGQYKQHALFVCILLIVFLITINTIYFPVHPWFLYAAFPITWWPISLFCGSKAKTLAFAFFGSMSIILYYSILNAALSPQYPWAIYPTFAVLWWPLALYYARQKNHFGFSVVGSLLTILFFIIVNAVSSPQTIWAIYPIFLVLWWPLATYYFHFKREELQNQNKKLQHD
ncbi:hypothetical protein [Desmospora activa]|uniref:Uncharacterized protein n=1 Tax=Desmospora activa DSM 45169 TaxID=1121389 RepID=A0A2T4Z1U6_9BACL|nr:hypothetical protein [Desmospora activa]PTM54744.1 hypothetical protein C8J48_3396 [Desmospora activa DSM 45169]